MGGKALKNTSTRRYERKEFDAISGELVEILNKTFKRVGMPSFYRSKPSFGDADIVISMEDVDFNLHDYITNTFNPNEIVHNGSCWSFDYKELQIDLITASAEDFESLYTYMCWNDCSNLIGKIAHGMGIKFGQQGLVYDHYFKGVNIGRVFISRDQKKILEFLGLSYDTYIKGFDELVEIFEFITASKYFNYEYVLLENLNKINRDRDKKRQTYQSFLDYIEDYIKRDIKHEFNEDKSIYLEMAKNEFPEASIELQIRKLEYEYCKELLIKAKFNGGDVMRKYDIKGKELGDAMTGFKQVISTIPLHETYDEYIINNSVEQIYSDFELYLNK